MDWHRTTDGASFESLLIGIIREVYGSQWSVGREKMNILDQDNTFSPRAGRHQFGTIISTRLLQFIGLHTVDLP